LLLFGFSEILYRVFHWGFVLWFLSILAGLYFIWVFSCTLLYLVFLYIYFPFSSWYFSKHSICHTVRTYRKTPLYIHPDCLWLTTCLCKEHGSITIYLIITTMSWTL
jgi:hypothetical protein